MGQINWFHLLGLSPDLSDEDEEFLADPVVGLAPLLLDQPVWNQSGVKYSQGKFQTLS